MFTPKPMRTDTITTQSDPPRTDSIIAISSTGKAMRGIDEAATTSRTPRVVRAPSAARKSPSSVATSPAPSATHTVVRAPAMSRLRMSRPNP